jgi:hypothetical protein
VRYLRRCVLTLGKSPAKEVPNPQHELRNRRNRNNSRTCTLNEPNVRLHRGGIARTPLRPSSRIEPWSTLVPIFPGKCGSTRQSSTRRKDEKEPAHGGLMTRIGS